MQAKAAAILEDRRQKWESKEILRRLYSKWYSIIGSWIQPGVVLELGGGSGNLKEYFPGAISSDVVFVPWLDAVLDAHRLPFRKETVDSIVLFDVLHHLSAPALFFSEAERILKPDGRIVMMEPFVSCASFLVYKFFHQEGLQWKTNPMDDKDPVRDRDPFQGNQAVPTLIFEQYRKTFMQQHPHLRILREEKSDFLMYPLSGGFHHRSFCPLSLGRFLERCERLLRPLKSCLAFRVLLVLGKRPFPT
ncbi:MAG: class I SAM-dependent methyltransferase [Thermodesulfobacteriota bacterium]